MESSKGSFGGERFEARGSHFPLSIFVGHGRILCNPNQKIESGSFSYHPECRALKLSSLAFADDLFFVRGVDAPDSSMKTVQLEEKNMQRINSWASRLSYLEQSSTYPVYVISIWVY